jgi:hypothetical protein
MLKYQYELHIDIYLISCLLICTPFSGDGCDGCHGDSSCHVCGDHPAAAESAAESVAVAVVVVELAVAFAGETEQVQ